MQHKNYCPRCRAELEFYEGALGFEDLRCPKCGYSVMEEEYQKKQKKR